MMKRNGHKASLLVLAGFASLAAGPAFALTDQQVAAINSGVLDVVQGCTFNADAVPDQVRALAAANAGKPEDASDVAGAIINAAQSLTDNADCLFSIGEGVTKWALTYGESNSTAIAIGTTIGQLGKIPVVNACVNTAGVSTKVGLACDPPTSDVLNSGTGRSGATFGNSGENPNQDDSSPN